MNNIQPDEGNELYFDTTSYPIYQDVIGCQPDAIYDSVADDAHEMNLETSQQPPDDIYDNFYGDADEKESETSCIALSRPIARSNHVM